MTILTPPVETVRKYQNSC